MGKYRATHQSAPPTARTTHAAMPISLLTRLRPVPNSLSREARRTWHVLTLTALAA